MRKLTLLLSVCLGLSSFMPESLSAAKKEEERVQNAAVVLKEIMAAPDKGIPEDVLNKAACVVVIPGLKKGGFGIGGERGLGLVSCRKTSGAWGPPSMLTMTGGSIGFQIGVQSIDLVMVIRNRRGIDFLTKDKFEVGGDISAAAGPVGRDAQAATDATASAEIYTYSRARGLFGGISLKGAVVKPDNDANTVIYGKSVNAAELLKEGNQAAPAITKPFLAELGKYSKH
jgi:SH3 domain-containing YSC84-like protein 1